MWWDILQADVYKDDNAADDVGDDKECDQLVLICCSMHSAQPPKAKTHFYPTDPCFFPTTLTPAL